jgi:tetratricopeptide (TPR) repeat protein
VTLANLSLLGFKIQLPEAPASETGAVKAWEQEILIRTWEPAAPDRNPMFLEKRVYQGSSGRVYPLPIIDRIETEPHNRLWKAIHIENEYVRFMILPELGGRIHVGLDKVNNYDFFYRQNVIKPALVGLAGPWISGGVEFNWPQHHRPATFMPVNYAVERDPDGSVTIWCSNHDPMVHMKGMHGVCLHPGRACLELRVRLYNRTTDTETFLWWANIAARVHEHYQSFFPRDVQYVADHARRAVTEFPLSHGTYYGVDYGKRAFEGVSAQERPRQFPPDGSYAPNDLSWYANIPVPTSYMIAASNGDFFGGYDHRSNAGFVHVADHHVVPGKKQWTWGNHDFGYAWDRNLTESDGPYIELMAGAYTDNQPDFSFLAPGETKTFQQFWYPIREIGVPDYANAHGAIRIERQSNTVHVRLAVTGAYPDSRISLRSNGEPVGTWQGDLTPQNALHLAFEAEKHVEFRFEQSGRTLIHYSPDEIVPLPKPEIATEPSLPSDVRTIDELFLIGLHLEQYRHPTRSPEPYWHEALLRDPRDSRANAALGRWHLRRGEFAVAEKHLRVAIERLTERNANPADGEPHYNLGLVLNHVGRHIESYAAFYKATWNAAWRGPAYHRLAEIDCERNDWETALDHLDRSIRSDTDNLNARNLKSLVLRRLGRNADAEALLNANLSLDPLDNFGRYLFDETAPEDGQEQLDLTFDFLRAGGLEEALAVSDSPCAAKPDGAATMLRYVRASILSRMGRTTEATAAYRQAATADSDYVFPSRLEEMLVLEEAIRSNPEDARAPYYLGNLFYDRRRHEEAIAMWERAVELDPSYPTAWRNLAFGYFNVMHDPDRSLNAFAKARANAPHDARILYEYDQLRKRTGHSPQSRLEELKVDSKLVRLRDDLSAEMAALYSSSGSPVEALSILTSRQFQPWEGGEGTALSQYVRANLLIGRSALRAGDAEGALVSFTSATNPPESLGETFHLLSNRSAIDYWLGEACAQLARTIEAQRHWERAAGAGGDPLQRKESSITEMTYWSALALRRLGREEAARSLLNEIMQHAQQLESQPPSIDYFATSLPAMLLFEEDRSQKRDQTARLLKAQALLGLGSKERAVSLLRELLEIDLGNGNAIDLLRGETG